MHPIRCATEVQSKTPSRRDSSTSSMRDQVPMMSQTTRTHYGHCKCYFSLPNCTGGVQTTLSFNFSLPNVMGGGPTGGGPTSRAEYNVIPQ